MAEPTGQVPDELLRQLHEATDHFHAAREELERWMNASEYRHQERINDAAEQLRAAEREVEQVEERIRRALAGEAAN